MILFVMSMFVFFYAGVGFSPILDGPLRPFGPEINTVYSTAIVQYSTVLYCIPMAISKKRSFVRLFSFVLFFLFFIFPWGFFETGGERKKGKLI